MKPLGKVVDCNSKTFIDFNKKKNQNTHSLSHNNYNT